MTAVANGEGGLTAVAIDLMTVILNVEKDPGFVRPSGIELNTLTITGYFSSLRLEKNDGGIGRPYPINVILSIAKDPGFAGPSVIQLTPR